MPPATTQESGSVLPEDRQASIRDSICVHLRLHRVWLRPPGPHYVHPGPRTGISWPMKPAPESVPSSAATSSATEPGALGKRRRTPATISATVRLPFANLQIKAPVRLTAIAAAVSGLTKRVQPSGPSSQIASGLGNGLSGRGMVGWYALSGSLRLGDRAGLRFVEVAAFLTVTTRCGTAGCRRAPQPTLHQSGAVSPTAMNRSPRRTPAADSPPQYDLSGPSTCLPAQTVSWFCSVRIDSAGYLQNLVIFFERRGSEATTPWNHSDRASHLNLGLVCRNIPGALPLSKGTFSREEWSVVHKCSSGLVRAAEVRSQRAETRMQNCGRRRENRRLRRWFEFRHQNPCPVRQRPKRPIPEPILRGIYPGSGVLTIGRKDCARAQDAAR